MWKRRSSWSWAIGFAVLSTPAVLVAQTKFCIDCQWATYPCTQCVAGTASGYNTCSPTCSGYCLTTGTCKVYASAPALGVYESRTVASMRELDAVNARQTVWLTSDTRAAGRLASAQPGASGVQELVAANAIARDCRSRILQRQYSPEERSRITRATEVLTL